jgi:2-C-methyl-D-erythritol 2,4-cyclodiphosphate synthase
MTELKITNLRIGQGYDIHRLVKERKLILGGIEIASELGLLGHSDADVLLHALMDALLGAVGKPDIGFYFPPSDEKYRSADSAELLTILIKEVLPPIKILNVDLTIIAEQPKIMGYADAIKLKIAKLLNISNLCVGLKATTNEKIGSLGRGEGMAANATALVCLI